MDADVTDSAGTPADPDHPAGKTPQSRSQEEPGAKPDAEPDATGPTESEKPGAEAEREVKAGSDAETGPETEARKADAGPEADAKAEANAKAGADADLQPGAGPKPGPEAEPKADAGSQAATGPAPEPGSGADPAPVPKAEPAAPSSGESTGVQTWADQPKDGSASRRKRPWLRWAALGASFLVLVSAGAGWWLYNKLDGNITTDTGAAAELKVYEKERPDQVVMDAQNILLIGSDSRAGDNSKYGRDDGGSQRSDTTILLHLAADRKSATAVSLPRDLMVEIPACRTGDDKETRERLGQFNSAFELGGTACTIRTVERLTGIRIDHHMVVDFNGFKDMVDAVDGVEICLKEPINDKDAHLELPAGRQTLNGEEALGYVRARKTLGDGSDTERMERQQRFLGALVNKMQSNGVLLNPTRLYPVLDAATKSLTTDPGLDSLRDLYDLVRSMRDVPTDQVQFLTVPRQPYRNNPNRDELVEPDASELFKQLREDKPVAVVPADELKDAEKEKETGTETGTGGDGKPDGVASESPTPTPTYSGSSAADDLCEQ
ncbi:LytR family transcriptional regulator [Streptomyces sp. KAI-26]|uniref:LCP family protein n=1 Tax=Streptomyces TaxID=1883 RepID=UPI0015873D27|nr:MULTISPECIES: LCP family protein [unclassified Streptomyces]NUV79787.1 LytR family transcriptional regulator [Streptomyces sp. CAI-155]NUV89729.1 LytR family transcriptional regulator [Streptomyces sp. KAI-26]NUW20046.1 LytR family transcriptional regulator [Streptomyces roseoviolaceus]